MSLLNKLFQATIKTATFPVAMVQDVLTLGGMATHQAETYTSKHLSKMVDSYEDVVEEMDKLNLD